MATGRTILDQARLAERSIPVCMRGDLAADHDQLERALRAAQQRPSDSLEGNGIGELVERIEAIQDQMRTSTHEFRLRALPKDQFRAMTVAHPPRRDEDGEIIDEDRGIEVNRETFLDALIRVTVIDPEFDDDDWTRLFGELLTDRQFGDLADACWFVNRGEVSVPFSRAALQAKRTSVDE